MDDDKTAKVQCIVSQGVWADVIGKDGKTTLRRVSDDEVVMVPRDAVLERMKKNRHVVEIR